MTFQRLSWAVTGNSLHFSICIIFIKKIMFCLLSSIIPENEQNDRYEQTVKCHPKEREDNYAGLHKMLLFHCWWLFLFFFFLIYLHRTRELENLFRTLSASARPQVGFRKDWASAPVTYCGQLDLLSVMLQSTWKPSKGSAAAGGQSPRPSYILLTCVVWTPLPKHRLNDKIQSSLGYLVIFSVIFVIKHDWRSTR